jgi:hypothetical protein
MLIPLAAAYTLPTLDLALVIEPGGRRCFEQSNPFLSHSRPAVPGTTQAM